MAAVAGVGVLPDATEPAVVTAARLPWLPLVAELELAALLVCDNVCGNWWPCCVGADDDCSCLSVVVAAASSAGGTADDGLRSMPVDSAGLVMPARAA